MKPQFILYRRNGIYYCEDTTTRKQHSLKTRDEAAAKALLHSKNEAFRQPILNQQIALADLYSSLVNIPGDNIGEVLDKLDSLADKDLSPKDRFLRDAAQIVADRTAAAAKATLARKNLARERYLYDEKVSARVDYEQAQAEAAAAALAAANTPEGAKATARQMAAAKYGWGDGQFSCLESLWTKESGWNYQAYNASSGATGIPQSLPGNKMASAGADWQTNATTQIAWGLQYIASAYGTPCSAWGHSQATDWY